MRKIGQCPRCIMPGPPHRVRTSGHVGSAAPPSKPTTTSRAGHGVGRGAPHQTKSTNPTGTIAPPNSCRRRRAPPCSHRCHPATEGASFLSGCLGPILQRTLPGVGKAARLECRGCLRPGPPGPLPSQPPPGRGRPPQAPRSAGQGSTAVRELMWWRWVADGIIPMCIMMKGAVVTMLHAPQPSLAALTLHHARPGAPHLAVVALPLLHPGTAPLQCRLPAPARINTPFRTPCAKPIHPFFALSNPSPTPSQPHLHLVLGVDALEHGRVLEHVGHDDKPHAAAADEDVLHVRDLAVLCFGGEFGQGSGCCCCLWSGPEGSSHSAADVGAAPDTYCYYHCPPPIRPASTLPSAPASPSAYAGQPAASRSPSQQAAGCVAATPPLQTALHARPRSWAPHPARTRAVAVTFDSCTFQLSSASCSSPR